MAALVVLAIVAGLAGLVFTSAATSGVALIAWGCLFGILARIAQAEKQHRELLAKAPERRLPTAVHS